MRPPPLASYNARIYPLGGLNFRELQQSLFTYLLLKPQNFIYLEMSYFQGTYFVPTRPIHRTVGAGGALTPLYFGRSVNLIQTKAVEGLGTIL